MKFKDSDSVIEEQMGISVSEIFQEYGEDYFRQLEKKFINEEEPNQSASLHAAVDCVFPRVQWSNLNQKDL